MQEGRIAKAVEISYKTISKKNTLFYVLTGAGISKASGIPTFRGENGFWSKYNFEEFATSSAWKKNPGKIWKLYQEGMPLIFNAKPNPAHYSIANLEEKEIVHFLITQNVDSLHQKAGSKKIIELHGNLSRIICTSCSKIFHLETIPLKIPPLCDCGGMLRPDIVLFDEALPKGEIEKALEIATKANLLLVVGTSAEVFPAASLPYISKRSGAKIILFNDEKTDHTSIADVFIQGPCEEFLPLYVEELLKGLEK